MIAESRSEEKEMMVSVVIKNSEYIYCKSNSSARAIRKTALRAYCG